MLCIRLNHYEIYFIGQFGAKLLFLWKCFWKDITHSVCHLQAIQELG